MSGFDYKLAFLPTFRVRLVCRIGFLIIADLYRERKIHSESRINMIMPARTDAGPLDDHTSGKEKQIFTVFTFRREPQYLFPNSQRYINLQEFPFAFNSSIFTLKFFRA
jgi:hypothetical protein